MIMIKFDIHNFQKNVVYDVFQIIPMVIMCISVMKTMHLSNIIFNQY